MKPDDWEKPRSRGTHLTEDEIGRIKDAYKAGRHYSEIARELKCSSRIHASITGFSLLRV